MIFYISLETNHIIFRVITKRLIQDTPPPRHECIRCPANIKTLPLNCHVIYTLEKTARKGGTNVSLNYFYNSLIFNY